MPCYTFEVEGGGEVDVHMPIKDAPPFGLWVTLTGDQGTQVRARRKPDAPIGTRAPSKETYVRSAPKWDPAGKRFSKNGTVLIGTQSERDDFIKKRADQGRPVAWD